MIYQKLQKCTIAVSSCANLNFVQCCLFLLQIYRTAYPEYEEVASSFIGDKLADDEWQAKLKLGKMCSTTGGNASVALMNQYLNSINQWAYIHNIPLTIPDELRWIR